MRWIAVKNGKVGEDVPSCGRDFNLLDDVIRNYTNIVEGKKEKGMGIIRRVDP